jgi:hypothetical protein
MMNTNGYCERTHNSLKNHGLHMLSGDVRTFVASEAFTTGMLAADRDPSTLAYLTIKALNGLALDPTVGNTETAFFSVSGDVVSFAVRFHTIANFIGDFSLPCEDSRAQQLIEAIQGNLDGKMFKAATIYRRLYSCSSRLLGSAERRARRARYEYETARRNYATDRRLTDAELAQADAIYDGVYQPSHDRITGRMRALTHAATPGFSGAFTTTVADFLYWNLPIQLPN